METPLRSVRKKAFSILDSTSFPDAATNTKSQLHHINITPINFDRTSNPHRMHTFHEASPERIETLINNNNTDEVSGTLTSSGIDSLADRVASLLGKPANFDPFETPNAKQTDSDDSKTIQKSVPLQDEDSSLQLLSKSIMNATHFNTSTNFVVPALATHDIRSPLQTLPFDQNNNNENNSSSSSDISNNPISFSSSSIRDYHSDREESKQTSEEVPYQRPPLTLPPRLSTIIEASKSTDSISRNSGSIMLEADRLLETINRLLSNKSRSQNQSTIDSLRKAASVQSAHSLSIPEQPSEKGDSTRKSSQASPNVNTEPDAICIEASDAETEYLEPPVEPPNARPMLSQTYNSHIYTSNKRKGKTATTASATAAASERQPRLAPNKRTTEQTTPPDSVATTANTRPFIKPPPPAVHRTTVSSSSSSSSSYQPKRTILEEKDNCLSQIQKGTDDLRRLHLELMQFESDYVKQHERRRAKKKAATLAASKKAAAGAVRGSSATGTESATTETISHSHSHSNGNGSSRSSSTSHNPNAKSGKDQKSLREQKLKGTASGRHIEGNKNASTAAAATSHAHSRPGLQASVARKASASAPSTTASPSSSSSRPLASEEHWRGGEARQNSSQAPSTTVAPPPHRHSNSNPRTVRFDHQHIELRMEPFRTIQPEDNSQHQCTSSGRGRSNKQTIQNTATAAAAVTRKTTDQRCVCCSRFAKMNGLSLQRNLDCLQLEKSLRFKGGAMLERPATAASRLNPTEQEEEAEAEAKDCCHEDHCCTRQKSSSCKSSLSNVNKSVQTSFLIDTADEQLMVANHCRPKTVAMGDYNNDYEDNWDGDFATYGFYQPGELSRTPPTTARNSSRGGGAALKKPVAYFVSLGGTGGGSEHQKKPSSIRASGSTHRSNNGSAGGGGRSPLTESSNGLNYISCINSKPSAMTNGGAAASLIQPVAAYRLAEAFERNCYHLKARSEMRAQRIKDNEELRRRTADSRQAEIIQTYMTEKKVQSAQPQSHRQQPSAAATNGTGHKVVTTLKGNSSKTIGAAPKPKGNNTNTATTNHESVFPNRPLQLITRRVVADKEMRQRTEKVYRKLPEVKAKCVTARREEDARRRRLMLNIFKQRLKENAIQGRLNWPITQHAITA